MKGSRFTETQIFAILKEAESGSLIKEVLNLYLFRNLGEVREITYSWIIDYNEKRPHDSLPETLFLNCPLKGDSLRLAVKPV